MPEAPRRALFLAAPVTPQAAIAVAIDQTFHFYSPDSLDILTAWGAELVSVSLLEDATLPLHVSGVYIGGGFLEMFATP